MAMAKSRVMSEPLRVLLVEDSEDDATLVMRELEREGDCIEFERVQNAEALALALVRRRCDIVICDYSLPAFSAPEALALVKKRAADVPFIVVSGTIGEHVAVDMLKAGAADYVMKDNLSRLLPAVRRGLRESEMWRGRRLAEQALRESEETFRLLWETTTDAAILMSDDSRILQANPAVAAVFGHTPEEVHGKTLAMLQPERLREPHKQGLARYLRTGERRLDWRGTETVGLHRDGHEFPLEVTFSHMTKGGRQVFAAFMRDISKRKLAQAALAESEEKFRQLTENITEVFWLTDPAKNQMLYISPAYEKIWGRDCQALYDSPRNWLDAIHPEDRDTVLRAATTKQASGDYDEEYRIVRPDGSVRWIRDRAFPIRDEHGRTFRVAGVASDITERKRVAEELRESERRFSSVLANVELISLMLDRDARITYCNDYLLRLTDWPREDVIGRNWFDLFIPADIVELKEVFAALIANRPEAWHHVNPILTRSGERRLIQWNNSVLRSVSGEVVGTASIGEDITDRKRAEETIERLAYRDTLTGLPNRVAMYANLRDALQRAEAGGYTLALLLLNLRGFRDINNTLGHLNGDELLKQVAARLRDALWESDMIGRVAGDEFVVLLSRLARPEDIQTAAEKIKQTLRAPFFVADIPLDVQATVGVALFPRDGTDTDSLFRHADVALNAARSMYQAFLVYDRSFDDYQPQKLRLMAELRSAIARNELQLYYQPKIDLRSRTIYGAEALVRWPHPTLGFLMPEAFIPICEKTGLIEDLTQWVLRAMLEQGVRWEAGGVALELSANVSAHDLQHPDFTNNVRKFIEGSGFRPTRLTLEITESTILLDPPGAKKKLMELSRLGVTFSIDDFGTGYSSLAYLKQLPVDELKIDKSFVSRIGDPESAAIVRGAIELAHSLGLRVTAEGVEDEAALQTLIALHCDFAQGYYISPPLAAGSFSQWLRASPWPLTA